MKILKIEPFSGISGDMFLAAAAYLLDAEEAVQALPAALGLKEVTIRFEQTRRGGLACRRMAVLDRATGLPVEQVQEAAHHHSHESNAHPHSHSGASAQKDKQQTTAHGHRDCRELKRLIDQADLPTGVQQRAIAILQLLAEAEAEVHGISPDTVCFHEVGAVDSLIDVVGAALVMDRLDAAQVVCTPVCTGFGQVHTAHGLLPVPAPATERLLRDMPVFPGVVEQEMTTPTGAAILRYLDPIFERQPLVVRQSACGAGTRDFAVQPNCLRLSLGEADTGLSGDLVLLQTNLDDLPGEQMGSDLLQLFLERGAADAFLAPIIMKKGRPGQKLEVLCREAQIETLASCILEHTTSLGVRVLPVRSRCLLPRKLREVTTPFGIVRVKEATTPSGRLRAMPEYEDCRRQAQAHGVSVQQVYTTAIIAVGELKTDA